MISAGRHIALLASVALLASPGFAAGDNPEAALDAWTKDASTIFSKVCLASAPEFTTLKTRALAAGFEETNGRLLFKPAAEVSLRNTGEICACAMTMGAPEPARLMIAVVDRLEADHPGAFRPAEIDGVDYSTLFEKGGKTLRVSLDFQEFKGTTFLAGFVIAEGACPE